MTWTGIDFSWRAFSLRAAAGSVCLAASFAGALLQAVLGLSYWPGNDATLGFAVFLVFGGLLGMAIPELWPGTQLIFRLSVSRFSAKKKIDQLDLAQTAFSISIVLMLLATIVGFGLCYLLAEAGMFWSQRFLVTGSTWRVIAFILPGISAWPMGIAFGLLVQLIYGVFVNLHCPDIVESSRPQLQRVLGSAIGWIVGSGIVGWLAGRAVSERYLSQWPELILISIILYLIGLFLAVTVRRAGKPGGRRSVKRLSHRGMAALPEVASPPSRSARLASFALGWVAIWAAAGWHFCWVNWYTGTETNGQLPPPAYAILLLPLAVLCGLGLGRWVTSPGPGRPLLTAVDRQGLALGVLGLFNLIMLPAMLVWGKEQHLGSVAGLIPTVICVGLVLAWTFCVVVSLPALAIGRPNRFELWLAMGSSLATGALAGLGSLVVWYQAGAGNLVGLALVTIVSIAAGAVALIYDEPAAVKSARRGNTRLHLICLFFLYGILGAVVLIVPRLKSGWLKASQTDQIVLAETSSGCSFLIERGSRSEIIGPNRLAYPTRTDLDLRNELTRIVEAIAGSSLSDGAGHSSNEDSFRASFSSILLGLPYISSVSSVSSDRQGKGVLRNCLQIDLARSLSEIETRARWEPGTQRGDLRLLRSRLGRFDLVVVLVPELSGPESFPVLAGLIRRAAELAASPDALWLITRGRAETRQKAKVLIEHISQLNRSERHIVLQVRGRGIWTLCSTARATYKLAQTMEKRTDSPFELAVIGLVE